MQARQKDGLPNNWRFPTGRALVHGASSVSGAAGRRASVDASESSGFLLEQLALTDGSPYAVTYRGGSSEGPEGRSTESRARQLTR